VYREEGLRGFYKGYLPRLLKKGASGAVIWSIYENIKKDFD
jgi:solute carrier family 25 protein 38